MADYIEREALLNSIYENPESKANLRVAQLLEAIMHSPAADVQPVVHGKWIWNEECECWVCSNCELSALNNYRGNSTDSNYCPNCGARMDGDSDG